jgi:hypothetical protein
MPHSMLTYPASAVIFTFVLHFYSHLLILSHLPQISKMTAKKHSIKAAEMKLSLRSQLQSPKEQKTISPALNQKSSTETTYVQSPFSLESEKKNHSILKKHPVSLFPASTTTLHSFT